MQFVHQGPDLPERLLQAHEDGRVVFFCGAGISYPARLPGFADLVKKTIRDIGDHSQCGTAGGDFGLAYLTECWAARFVSELFRNYTVCFVG